MKLKKVIGILICLLIISIMFILGYTFSSYKNNISSQNVLKWSFNSPNSETRIKLSENKIMPGSTGNFKIEIDATNSETKINYKIIVLEEKNLPINFVFWAEIADQNNNILNKTTEYNSFSKLAEENLNGDIEVEENNQKRIITIFWSWKFVSDEDSKNQINYENLKIDESNSKYEIKLEIIGKQVENQ